jgi:hypothetical protein
VGLRQWLSSLALDNYLIIYLVDQNFALQWVQKYVRDRVLYLLNLLSQIDLPFRRGS